MFHSSMVNGLLRWAQQWLMVNGEWSVALGATMVNGECN